MLSLLINALIAITCLAQEKSVPPNYLLKKEAYGDLDKDSIAERVVVYDIITSQNENEGINREIVIYKKEKENWKVWHRSKNAVKNSTEGGMMGDPFEGVEISKGILVIYHWGGSSTKWSQTDRYRFQHNRFELIGFKEFSGRPCDEWFGFDYNISTGKIEVTNEFEKCDENKKNENTQVVYKRKNEIFTYKLSTVLTLGNRYQDSEKNPIMIVSPKYKHELYLKF